MTIVAFCGREGQREQWGEALGKWSRELGIPATVHLDPTTVDPKTVDVVIANPRAEVKDFSIFSNARLFQNMWVGVEEILANGTIPADAPLCRMVEDGITEGMTDYICGHVLRHHLDIDKSIHDTANGVWDPAVPPISRDRRVGVLGLGALGADAARMLAQLRFDVAGWSRTPKQITGVSCHSGADGLRDVIARSEIIVTILPLTDDTRHVMNAETLSLAPKGAVIINPGRGPLIDDEALLAALKSGHIGHATLDVFAVEPLPADHPYWHMPNVTVTPHIAAETRTDGAARTTIEQIGRLQRGEPLSRIVDRELGY
ncbi:MAG: 2-hydroxyacid dehydrogenase [Pikeienuella sp.]